MSALLQTEKLTKIFRQVDALLDVTMDVAEGAIFALVGPNGAGKTTAIQTLLNVHQPTSGRAVVFGVDSRALGASEFARIGYVSENQLLPEWMTVGQFLAYRKAFYPAWSDADAADLVRLVRTAARPQAQCVVTRHADPSGIGLFSCLSTEVDRS